MAAQRWSSSISKTYPAYGMLNSQIESNYNKAIAYYKQKEAAFEKALAAQGSRNVKKRFKEEMDKYAKKWLDNVRRDFYQLLSHLRKNGFESVGSFDKWSKGADTEYKADILELVKSFYSEDKGRFNYAGWGAMFEAWLAQHTIGPGWSERTSTLIKNKANNLIASAFGKTSQAAATRARASETTTDIMYSAGGKTGKDVGQIELTSWLNLEAFDNISDQRIGSVLLSEIQKAAIDQTVFGFQLKAYTQGLDNMRWSNSSVLSKGLLEAYASSKERTWSSNYAALYPYYYLSKYVINIVNPVNVGSITPRGLEYTSDLLSHIRFFMGVTWEGTGKDEDPSRGGGEAVLNVKPASDVIFMRDGAGAGRTLGFQAKMTEVALYKEKITIASVGFS